MIYFPAYVHHGLDHSASGYFPGIPGACLFAGDTIEECMEDAKSALEAHLELMNFLNPIPTKISDHLDDKEIVGGFWVMIGVDPSKYEGAAVEISISIKAGLLHQIDQAIQDSPTRYPSRDELIVRAVRQMLNHP